MRPFHHLHVAFAITLSLIPSLAVRAENKLDRLNASDIFNLQYASDPQISPDGKRIVYVRTFADIMTDKRLSNLWIVGFDGNDHRALTAGNLSDESPRWSPDGTRLAFLSDRDGTRQLYVRWMDTGKRLS
jgi:Tol biopolymer transport system component